MRITFKKCKGFHYSQSGHNIFLEFPFQRFFIDQLPFVFENKNFHTQRFNLQFNLYLRARFFNLSV